MSVSLVPARAAAIAAISVASILGLAAGCTNSKEAPQGAPSSAAPSAQGQLPHEPEMTGPPTPAISAGPLSDRQLPDRVVLGPGWSTYAEPGGGESGVIGNGSWAQQRPVAEVMDGLTPIGCPVEAVNIRLSRPRLALEGSYRGPGQAPGVGLVLEFADSRTAAQFLDRLGAQIQACAYRQGTPDSDGPLVLTFDPLPSRGSTLSALRQEYGVEADPYRYLLVAAHQGRRIGMVYLAGGKPEDRQHIAVGLAAAIAR
jgi:hypothetical protein